MIAPMCLKAFISIVFNTSTSHLNNSFIHVDLKLVFIAAAALFSRGINKGKKENRGNSFY